MSIHLRISLFLLAILAGVMFAWGLVQAAPGIQSALPTPTPLPNQPAVDQPVVNSPDISFIESPAPSCMLPKPGTGNCFMTWNYLYAYADPSYMITMTVEIDDMARARFNGFFQTYMYVPTEMMVFRVACGAPGSGGDPNFGMSHSYTLRARDSDGLKAANSGTVLCPSDTLHIRLPMVWK